MVEKVWYCRRCHYTSQPITTEEGSKTCPTCGYQCKMMDFIPAKDFEADTNAMYEDAKREGRVAMNQQEMTDIVSEELTHIPSGYGVRHGWLLHYYNRRRRHDLVKGKTKEETLSWCIDVIRREDPNWNPEYDITFFKI